MIAATAIAAVASRPFDQDLNQIVVTFLQREHIPGAVVAFGRSDGAPRLRAFGYADVEAARPMSTGDRFRIASLSKPVTAAAVLELVHQGRLRLDDRLGELFPEVLSAPDRRHRDISVRDLLRHSGGWDRDLTFDPIADPDAAREVLGLNAPTSCQPISERMLTRPLDFTPGESYAYSNLGYCWLEQIIERVDGRHYEEAIHALVLDGIGAKPMRIATDSVNADATVSHYGTIGNGAPPQRLHGPPSWFHVLGAAGGWVASAEEVYRIASRPVDPATFEKPAYGPKEGDYYGLGWHIWPSEDGFTLTHYGSLPGVFSLIIRTQRMEVIVALFNARPADDVGAFRRLLAELPAAVRRTEFR